MDWETNYADKWYLHRCVLAHRTELLWSYLQFYRQGPRFAALEPAARDEAWNLTVNACDERGYTPMTLAAALGQRDTVQMLAAGGASVLAATADGWTPYDEATARRDTELMAALVRLRAAEMRRHMKARLRLVGKQLAHNVPDVELALTWRVKSWIPLVSAHDECVLVKRGRSVRVDLSIIGFEGLRWKRTRATLYYDHVDKAAGATLAIVDHTTRTFQILRRRRPSGSFGPRAGRGSGGKDDLDDDSIARIVAADLAEPIVRTVRVDRVALERAHTRGAFLGLAGRPQPRCETIGDYLADVWHLDGVFARVEERHEHLLGVTAPLEPAPSPEAYFGSGPLVIGRPRDLRSHTADGLAGRRLSLWTFPSSFGNSASCAGDNSSDEFPLQLSQLLPLLDLVAMGSNNAHVATAKEFIASRLPELLGAASGDSASNPFPVQLELPLHRLVTFGIQFPRCRRISSVDEETFRVPMEAQGYSPGRVLKFAALGSFLSSASAEGSSGSSSDSDGSE